MTEWREVALGEVATISWGDTSTTKASYVDEGFAAYSASGQDGYLPHADHSDDGVVISAIGARCGKTWFATGSWSCIKNTMWMRGRDGLNTRFLYYATSNPAQWPKRGAAQPFIGLGDAKAMRLGIPDIATQRVIVQVLSSLDDLIANNRRRVEVLEKIARAIYREWFVKFRYPGHSDVLMIDSSLGPIPEGWAAGKISDLCLRVQAGATPRRSTSEYWNDPVIDWYKTGDLTDSVLLGSSEKLSEIGLAAGRTFEPETILMAIYGSPTVGRLGLLPSRASANQAALGLVANLDVCTTEFLWFTLERLREYLNQIAQGAAQQNVSKQKVIDCDVLIPPREVIENFTLIVAPVWRLSHELARGIASLESLRNLLLPKLVTGQIDVSTLDLDALLEEAAA